jgi:hypothetical protein
LISNEVEFVVVGALAVAWHGFPRYSGDIDFLVRPTEENARRVVQAINQFGMASLGISVEDLSSEGKVVQMGYEPHRIDVMTSVTGVTFEQVWDSRAAGQLDGIPVSFIGRAALLRNKDATGRPKDRIDAIALREQDDLK